MSILVANVTYLHFSQQEEDLSIGMPSVICVQFK